MGININLSLKNKDRPRILIVDDDPDTTLFLRSCLEDNGFHVFVYNDPFSAMSGFIPNFYDLLLIDIRMPQMTGFELYEMIKKLDKRVKVCFITAFEEYYNYLNEQFPDLDVTCYIKKPVTTKILIDRVKSEIISKT